MPRYRLVIFDFDGTLADSWRVMAPAMLAGAERFGYRRLTLEEAEQLRGQDGRAVMRALDIQLWQLPRIVTYMRRVARDNADRITLFDGVAALLPALAAAEVRVAMVSSNSETVVRRVLGPDLSSLVTDFDCGAAIFGKATRFRRVLRRARLEPSHAVGVGDEVRDIEAAREAGLASVAVTWGYASRDGLEGASPTHGVTCVDDLARLLLD